VEQIDASQLVAPDPPVPVEEVETSQLVAPSPPDLVEPLDTFQVAAPLYQQEEEPQTGAEPDVQFEPESERSQESEPQESEQVSGPVETNEERYERLMVEAYGQVIHVAYAEEFDAVGLSFSGCPVRQSSDVPWVFKTISHKIQKLLAPQPWRQHPLLVDVARLQVATEAQAAWEMMLDGFVTQSCPEVTPDAVLAIQFDSSLPPAETPEPGAVTEELQLASSVTGQQRPVIQASSHEAALLLLQLLHTEL
jgi:hypothetical protein